MQSNISTLRIMNPPSKPMYVLNSERLHKGVQQMLDQEQIDRSLQDQAFIRSELSGFVANPEQAEASCCFVFDDMRRAFPLFHESFIDFFDRIRVDVEAVKNLADEFELQLSREHIPKGDGNNHDFIFRQLRENIG